MRCVERTSIFLRRKKGAGGPVAAMPCVYRTSAGCTTRRAAWSFRPPFPICHTFPDYIEHYASFVSLALAVVPFPPFTKYFVRHNAPRLHA
jgi:hypothetical protein